MVVFGAINWDTTVFVDRFAGPGEEVPVNRIEVGPGGKGANVAVAAARLLGRGKVSFIGALGDDSYANELRTGLEKEGVVTGTVANLRGASGQAFIVVDSHGMKTIHTWFGANELLRPGHQDSPSVTKAFTSSSIVVLMDSPSDVTAAAARRARRRGMRIVYCPGVRSADGIEALADVLALADDAVFDRSEIQQLLPRPDPRSSVKALMARFPKLTVVATLGPDGSIVGKRGVTRSIPPVRLADLGMKAVNSTGSGDAFLAAYVCYLIQGRPPDEAAMWGNLAGALKATSPSTRGSPTKRTLESTMTKLRPRRPG